MNAARLAALAVVGGIFLMMSQQTAPRGIRNNNPGNIRTSADQWRGAAGDDGEFVIFESPEYGVRAMTRILKSYARRGVVTLSAIVTTWAPPNENNTEAYVSSVAQRTGWAPDRVISESDYPALIAAIIHHENGRQPYALSVIEQGVALA